MEISHEILLSRIFNIRNLIFPDIHFAAAFAPLCSDYNVTINCNNRPHVSREDGKSLFFDTAYTKIFDLLTDFLHVYKELYVQSIRAAKKEHDGRVLHPLLCNFIGDAMEPWKKLKRFTAFHHYFDSNVSFWMSELTVAQVYENIYHLPEDKILPVTTLLPSVCKSDQPPQSPFQCNYCRHVYCAFDNLHVHDEFCKAEELAIIQHGIIDKSNNTATSDEEFENMIRILFADSMELIIYFFQPYLQCVATHYRENRPIDRYWKFKLLAQLFSFVYLFDVKMCVQYSSGLNDPERWKELGVYDSIQKMYGGIDQFLKAEVSLGASYIYFKHIQ